MFFNFTTPRSLERYLFTSPGAHMASKYTSIADILSAGPIIKRSQEATMSSTSTCDISVRQIGKIPFEIWMVIAAIVLLVLLVFGGIFALCWKLKSRRQANDVEKVQMGQRRVAKYTGDGRGSRDRDSAYAASEEMESVYRR